MHFSALAIDTCDIALIVSFPIIVSLPTTKTLKASALHANLTRQMHDVFLEHMFCYFRMRDTFLSCEVKDTHELEKGIGKSENFSF